MAAMEQIIKVDKEVIKGRHGVWYEVKKVERKKCGTGWWEYAFYHLV